jgi:hypothetical protein
LCTPSVQDSFHCFSLFVLHFAPVLGGGPTRDQIIGCLCLLVFCGVQVLGSTGKNRGRVCLPESGCLLPRKEKTSGTLPFFSVHDVLCLVPPVVPIASPYPFSWLTFHYPLVPNPLTFVSRFFIEIKFLSKT